VLTKFLVDLAEEEEEDEEEGKGRTGMRKDDDKKELQGSTKGGTPERTASSQYQRFLV
jgi:hypothetical protein